MHSSWDRFQYLAILLGCALLTLPLEWLYGARVWRRPRRLARALALPLAVFWIVNAAAIGRGLWSYSERYTAGWHVPVDMPVEEVVFFLVIPLCAILTFQTACNVYDGRVAPLWRRVTRRPSTRGSADPRPGAAPVSRGSSDHRS